MMGRFNLWVKERIALSGVSPSPRIDHINRLLEVGRWIREHRDAQHLETRDALYAHLNSDVLGNGPIDYLEFGVFEGRSISRWACLNTDARSRFTGFDTFEGLPEEWRFFTRTLAAGTFSTGGKIPQIADQRVTFLKGIFQDTLPVFLKDFRPRSRLVVNCDADLYTSTLFVMASLHHLLIPGSVVIFDEFSDVHEFRAVRDYTRSFRPRYEVLATSERFCSQVALRFC